MTTNFRVGKGIGIAYDSTLALFEPLNGALAESLWALVADGAGIDELLEELSTTGLRSLGSFAMAQFEDSQIRIVVRGTARARVSGAGGPREIGAAGVRTWVEEVVDGVDAVELALDELDGSVLPFRVERGLLPADVLQQANSQVVAAPAPQLDGMALDWADDFHASEVFVVPSLETEAAAAVDEVEASVASVAAVPQPEPAPAVVTVAPEAEPEPTPESEPDPTPEPEPEPAPEPEPEPAATDAGAADPGRTITSTDFGEFTEPAEDEPPVTEQVPVVAQVDAVDEYDEIYGRTMARSVHSAAVHVVEEEPAEASPVEPAATGGLIQGVPSETKMPLGDHDGRTMTKAQIAALRAAQSGVQPVAAPSTMGGPTVQALLCASQHPNPPQLTSCRVCHGPLLSPPVHIARPVLGTLRFTNGAAVALDRPVLIGRNPKVEGGLAGEIPQLVKLDVGPGLSRTHASIRLEGWQVLLEDLNSANGTIVRLPGREPRRLHPGEPILLELGSDVDLGGEINCVLDAS